MRYNLVTGISQTVCSSSLKHIWASVDVIEGCLTALTRKPHAEDHRGDASPAESEFLARTEIYDIQACACKFSTQASSPILFGKFCCSLFLQSSFVFPSASVAPHPAGVVAPEVQRSVHAIRDRVIRLDRHHNAESTWELR